MHRSNKLAYFNMFQLILDLLCIIVSFFLAYLISSEITKLNAIQYYFWMLSTFIPLWISVMAIFGMYNTSTFNYYDRILKNILLASIYSAVIVVDILFFIKEVNISRILYVSFVLISFTFTLLARYIYVYIVRKNRSSCNNNVLLIVEREMYNKFQHFINKTSITLNIIKKVVLDNDMSVEQNEILSNRETFEQFLKDNVVDEIIFGLPLERYNEIQKLNEICSEIGITSKMMLDFPHKEYCKTSISSLGNIPMITIHSVSLNNLQHFYKRVMDIIGALTGIILFSPICILTALAIKIEKPGPILFTQNRVGKNGRIFKIYKFRSMVVNAEEKKKGMMQRNENSNVMLFKIKNDPRVTKVGKFIRKTSIDELPQLINVIKGEMSLVGTRPPTVDEVEKYNLSHWRRISIKPGITGMWQVNGRSDIKDFDNVVKLDTKYIEEWSIWLDIKIIIKTVLIVINRKGAY